MRVVFDTDAVVSACFWRGAPFDCLAAWGTRRFQAALSPPLLAEYEETFEEPFIDYHKRLHVDWIALLRTSAGMFFPVDRATGATPDPFDEMVLECALASEADVIISGDKKHLLVLGEHRGIPSLNPVDFLKQLG
jgi:putative PIN family toxin of toxin-antitoxin system